jgi:hypothetical protein
VIRAQDKAKQFDELSNHSQTFTRLRKAAASTAHPQACRPFKRFASEVCQTRRDVALNGHPAGFWSEEQQILLVGWLIALRISLGVVLMVQTGLMEGA